MIKEVLLKVNCREGQTYSIDRELEDLYKPSIAARE